jgi:hypothetical protein
VTSVGGLDRFAISSIASPQSVGTPITGITLTAQDAANQTVTSFTGTVTFGGTAGVTGTSASFVAGVLSGVSITPTVMGSNLTFTVNDGAGHTGSTSFTVISLYASWANGFLPADISATAGNNDGDKLNNLQEYAFGTDPTISTFAPLSYVLNGNTTSGMPILESTGSSGGLNYAVFARRKDHLQAGLTYQVQFSANLNYWKNSIETPLILSGTNADAIEAVRVPFPPSVPLSAAETEHAPPRFFRIGVSGN